VREGVSLAATTCCQDWNTWKPVAGSGPTEIINRQANKTARRETEDKHVASCSEPQNTRSELQEMYASRR
jgi:hypothetical protein